MHAARSAVGNAAKICCSTSVGSDRMEVGASSAAAVAAAPAGGGGASTASGAPACPSAVIRGVWDKLFALIDLQQSRPRLLSRRSVREQPPKPLAAFRWLLGVLWD